MEGMTFYEARDIAEGLIEYDDPQDYYCRMAVLD